VLDAFLEWVAGLPTLAVYLVLMALSALENVVPPVPADVAVVLGAFLAQRGVTSATLLGFCCWLANVGSSAAVYYLARARGEAFFRSGWARTLVPPRALEALRREYARHGVLGIFLSRFLPGLRAAVTPFAGVAGMPPARVLVPAAAASAIWYTFLVVVGSALGLHWDAARRFVEDTTRALGLIAALATAAAVLWLWRKRGVE
jgi:membrane protein DedA with SNARE-associated domain